MGVLSITRNNHERICISCNGYNCWISVASTATRRGVRLTIDAPPEFTVLREELINGMPKRPLKKRKS
jgi:sRNA-binding carbon storage regulator CsrA